MNIQSIMTKITQGKTRLLVRVLAVGIIFSVTAFLIFLDMSKEYRASVSILVTAKNETFASQLDRVIWNIVEFPKMLSFYERLAKSNPEIKKAFQAETKDETKKLWNEKVETEIGKIKQDSIVKLSVFSKTSNESKELIAKTSQNLFEFSSGYYNAKEEVELKIVDGPFVSAVSRNNFKIIPAAIIVGMLSSLFLNLVLVSMESIFASVKRSPQEFGKKKTGEFILPAKQEDFSIKKVEERYVQDVPYVFEKNDEEIEFEIEKNQVLNLEDEIMLEPIFKDNPYPNYPEMPVAPKKASAPDNLPIAEEVSEDFFAPKESEFIEMKKHEPTDEELKERLNKLLRGEL